MFSKLLIASVVAMSMAEDLPGIYTSGGDLLIRAPGEARFNRMKFDQVSSDDLERSNQQIAKHVNTFGNDLDALEKSDTSITAALAKAHEKLVDELDEKFGALKDTLTDNKAAIDAKINKQVVAAEKTSSELEEAATDILERIEAHEDCMKDGLVYNENKNRCFEVDQDASKMIGKVWHRMFNNEDSREGGWLNERYIKFTKALDDTYLRVVYYDNFRVHGHLSHGKWHVMFCDANGNGCAECNDPGQIGMWKWARHQGNWWMNDHIHGSVTGMCRRSENRQLRKGEYQVRIYLDQARYDVHTGSSGGNHIMVDEVVKY